MVFVEGCCGLGCDGCRLGTVGTGARSCCPKKVLAPAMGIGAPTPCAVGDGCCGYCGLLELLMKCSSSGGAIPEAGY